MDPSGKITEVALGNKGAKEDSTNIVISAFDKNIDGVEAGPGCREEWGGILDMVGIDN